MTQLTSQRYVVASFVITFGLTAGSTASRAADVANALPVYRFEVGQELTYKGESQTKSDGDSKQPRYTFLTDWKATVVRKNADGSYRLIVRSTQKLVMDGKANGAHSTIGYCDVFPDGRIVQNSTLGYSLDPSPLFPRLPDNAKEVAAGWEDIRHDGDGSNIFKVESQPKSPGGDWKIAEVRKSPLDEIYLMTYKGTVTFDPKRGLVTKVLGDTTQGYGIKGKGTQTLELVSVDKHDPAWAAKLAHEADVYFQANQAYEDKFTLASKDDKASKKLLDEAKAILTTAQKEISLPLLKEQLDETVKSHKNMVSYAADEAARRAKVVGHPAAEWEATDLKGKSHTLKEFHGKVVVMDFWYRGCGWCMRAMPQVKQLAAEFKGQPVVVLGMNTDRDEADAKFVVDKMKLDYATLKIDRNLPEKYGVQGFPTMIIIDQQGKVHDMHVGYSPTLQREVGEIVRQLLAKR
jgi:thiol-disulfide isomerase/thioredoxin